MYSTRECLPLYARVSLSSPRAAAIIIIARSLARSLARYNVIAGALRCRFMRRHDKRRIGRANAHACPPGTIIQGREKSRPRVKSGGPGEGAYLRDLRWSLRGP